MQCVTDLDCHAVGLLDGVCRDNVCQPQATDSAATGAAPGATSSMVESVNERTASGANSSGSGAVRTGTNVGRNPDEEGGAAAAGGSSAAATGTKSTGAPTAASASSATSTTSSAGAAGAAETSSGPGAQGTSSQAAQPGKSCTGPSCDCSVDADCAARGIAGGTCVESHCWEPEAQCASDDECSMRGPEFVGGRCQDKQCLPNPRFRCEPQPPASASQMIELVLPVIDALQLAPLANVKVSACNKLDLTCMQPISTVTTGMDGKAKLMVPANFAGYMQQIERTDYVPAMYFRPAALPMDGQLSNLPLVPSAAFSGLAVALGAEADNKRGHAMLIVEDCKGIALAGIKFNSPQADMSTVTFYVRDQIPTSNVMDTPPEGDGGFANLPPGTVEITATEAKTGLVINTITVLVRPGYITTAYIRPASRGSTVTGRFPLGPNP